MSDFPAFSAAARHEHLRALAGETWDLLVVGGGITGAAAARDAAGRGLRVALVDAGDLARGTSSRSSRLIHGGLRYLETGTLKLDFDASAERR
ncbi:MAG: FAD-dependent oxidoreductase, partial [Gemmatimonadetes bacterium]|nr:FAD-dependent oxidoreductase [Gemmatimonadota bacterium]